MARTDVELVELAKRGDMAAFGELWSRCEPTVLSICRRFVSPGRAGRVNDAEDLVSETWIRLRTGLRQFEDRSSLGVEFGAWVVETTRNACLRSLEREKRRAGLAEMVYLGEPHRLLRSPGPTVEQAVASRHLLKSAAEAIQALPEIYREPLLLSLEQLSHRDIACELGISTLLTAKRVQRARSLLSRKLAPLLIWRDEAGGPATLHRIEGALAEIVFDWRIVTVPLQTGGELQLCVRAPQRVNCRPRRSTGRHGSASARLDVAEALTLSGRWDEARAAYGALLKDDPASLEAALRLGEMLESEHRPTEAEAVYREALAHAAAESARQALSGALLSAAGDYISAAAAYECALAVTRSPGSATLSYRLCEVLGRLSRYEEQLALLECLRRQDPNDLRTYTDAYSPCAQLARFKESASIMERALLVDPNDPLALKLLF